MYTCTQHINFDNMLALCPTGQLLGPRPFSFNTNVPFLKLTTTTVQFSTVFVLK